ncbi:hypothetical protein EYF80_060002 [Liparis tanakae]|uniref:Uncharacterized protein n=1 Tax=Liparis tanakae TaxID=230148 RepID=A0A4Z2EM73_9TELE|nr:hypothetical protein EYF80_060002 [Liparis tanakae]
MSFTGQEVSPGHLDRLRTPQVFQLHWMAFWRNCLMALDRWLTKVSSLKLPNSAPWLRRNARATPSPVVVETFLRRLFRDETCGEGSHPRLGLEERTPASSGEDAGVQRGGRRRPAARTGLLTTSLGRLCRSSYGVSSVLVSTFRTTTCSMLFTSTATKYSVRFLCSNTRGARMLGSSRVSGTVKKECCNGNQEPGTRKQETGNRKQESDPAHRGWKKLGGL